MQGSLSAQAVGKVMKEMKDLIEKPPEGIKVSMQICVIDGP